jgi:hypothetical protein
MVAALAVGALVLAASAAAAPVGTPATGKKCAATPYNAGGAVCPPGSQSALRLRVTGVPERVALHARHRQTLVVPVHLSRAAALSVDLRRGNHRTRHAVMRHAGAGTVRISLGLRGLSAGGYTLRVSGYGVGGGSAFVSRHLQLVP